MQHGPDWVAYIEWANWEPARESFFLYIHCEQCFSLTFNSPVQTALITILTLGR
jgi:hypothetical protein